jgi:hypothetical protein
LLLLPGMVGLDLPELVRAAGYPGTRVLSAWQSPAFRSFESI